MNPAITQTSRVTKETQLLSGMEKHLGSSVVLVIQGKSYTATEAVALLQSRVDALNAIATTKANWKAAIAADQSKTADTKAFLSGLRQILLVMFGDNPAIIGDLGLVLRKQPEPKTLDAKQQAMAKVKATREARHTMGPKQKAAIKGVVPVATHPAAPFVVTHPAPSPAPATVPNGSQGETPHA
jgi:hypothetical protein